MSVPSNAACLYERASRGKLDWHEFGFYSGLSRFDASKRHAAVSFDAE